MKLKDYVWFGLAVKKLSEVKNPKLNFVEWLWFYEDIERELVRIMPSCLEDA